MFSQLVLGVVISYCHSHYKETIPTYRPIRTLSDLLDSSGTKRSMAGSRSGLAEWVALAPYAQIGVADWLKPCGFPANYQLHVIAERVLSGIILQSVPPEYHCSGGHGFFNRSGSERAAF